MRDGGWERGCRLWRDQTEAQLQRAGDEGEGVVHVERYGGCASGGSEASHRSMLIERKVLIPVLFQWVEQRCPQPGLRVERGCFVGFVKAAGRTLEDEIVGNGESAGTSGEDVVDVKNGRLADLEEAAVATARGIAREYLLAKCGRNGRETHGVAVCERAIETIWLNWAICARVSSSALSRASSWPSVLRSRSSCKRSVRSAERPEICESRARGTEKVTGSANWIIVPV